VDRAIAISGGLVLSAISPSFAALTSTACSKSFGTDTGSFTLSNVVPFVLFRVPFLPIAVVLIIATALYITLAWPVF
jgi:hypothetical protein